VTDYISVSVMCSIKKISEMDVTNYSKKCSNKIGSIVTSKSGFLRTFAFFFNLLPEWSDER